jgi:uncharacterized protein YcfJ
MKKILVGILSLALMTPAFADYTRCYPVQKRVTDYYGNEIIYVERICETVREPVVIYREVPRAEPRYDSSDIAGAIVFGAIVGAIINKNNSSNNHNHHHHNHRNHR